MYTCTYAYDKLEIDTPARIEILDRSDRLIAVFSGLFSYEVPYRAYSFENLSCLDPDDGYGARYSGYPSYASTPPSKISINCRCDSQGHRSFLNLQMSMYSSLMMASTTPWGVTLNASSIDDHRRALVVSTAARRYRIDEMLINDIDADKDVLIALAGTVRRDDIRNVTWAVDLEATSLRPSMGL